MRLEGRDEIVVDIIIFASPLSLLIHGSMFFIMTWRVVEF